LTMAFYFMTDWQRAFWWAMLAVVGVCALLK
jgi:hypothetical protein